MTAGDINETTNILKRYVHNKSVFAIYSKFHYFAGVSKHTGNGQIVSAQSIVTGKRNTFPMIYRKVEFYFCYQFIS